MSNEEKLKRLHEATVQVNFYYDREKVCRSIKDYKTADYWQQKKMAFLNAVEVLGYEWEYTSQDHIVVTTGGF